MIYVLIALLVVGVLAAGSLILLVRFIMAMDEMVDGERRTR